MGFAYLALVKNDGGSRAPTPLINEGGQSRGKSGQGDSQNKVKKSI